MINLKYEKISNASDKKFKRMVGVKREVFEFLVAILEDAYKEKHKYGGREASLSREDMLLLTFSYLRDYTTFLKLGAYFDLDESNAYRNVTWVESVLQPYMNEDFDITKLDLSKEYIVDVTECTVTRSKVKEIQREYYSGKKKKHTIKIQIIIEEETKKIVHVAFEKGSVHDFKLFKQSTTEINKDVSMLGDSGYQGMDKELPNSMTPKKKSKNNPLTDQDNELNKLISSYRISVEHVNCQLKIFRILSERYRNRKHTFANRALFLCSLYNFCLGI